MIKKIIIEDLQDTVDCKSDLYQSRESFLKCSFKLSAGEVYGVISDFGYGSWGLVTCLAGRGNDGHSGTVIIDGRPVTLLELSHYACVISEKNFPNVNTPDNLLTPKECIEKALSISMQPFSTLDIKRLFKLTNERFERSLDKVSGEIWQISAAVNFSLGKDIFCFPWLNEFDISRFEIFSETGVLDFLKKQGKIVLVPSSQTKIIKRLCDHYLRFFGGKFSTN